MRLGCCISDGNQAAALEMAGAEFCEVSVARAVMAPGDGYERLAASLAESRVPVRAANVFLPGDLRVVGPDADGGRLREHAATALARLERLGVRVLVFGSGRARAVPEGFDRERALEQFAGVLREVATEAAGHGVTVALEPLRPAETDLLNTVAESAAFIRERDVGPARLLADLYHMREQGEAFDVLGECADLLVHVHVAGVARRRPGPDAEDLEPFLGALRAAGYAGDCSIECQWTDFAAEVPQAVADLRAAAVRAGWEEAHV